MAVHARHRSLIAVVRGRAQALDQHLRTTLSRVLGKQHARRNRLHAHALNTELLQGLAHEPHALLEGEAVLLGAIMRHTHDHLVKELSGPGNDFQVAVVHGVKRSGAEGNHGGPFTNKYLTLEWLGAGGLEGVELAGDTRAQV